MGNYGDIPQRPALPFNSALHEAETNYLQRIKQTPFINSEVYTLNPPIFVETVDMKLSQLLQPRMLTKQLFPLPEVYKMLGNILTAFVELEQQGFRGHGDISAQTIYYDAKSKKFKLIHPLLIQHSAYELMRDRKRLSYLSPEQLLALSEGLPAKTNQVSLKSDIFSLGVVMCEVCSLLPSTEIYCPETYSIFDLQIQNRFNMIRDYYRENSRQGMEKNVNSKLLNWIQDMLQYDEGMRKNAKQLLKIYCENGELGGEGRVETMREKNEGMAGFDK